MNRSTFWKKLARILFSQKTTIIMLLLLQIFFIMSMILGALDFTQLTYYLLSALGLILAVYICNQDVNPGYKLAWVIPLLAIPLFSTVAYFILSNQYSTRAARKKHIQTCEKTAPYLRQDPRVISSLIIENNSLLKLSQYLDKFAGYPTCCNTTVEYFSGGAKKFKAMVRELRKAERFMRCTRFFGCFCTGSTRLIAGSFLVSLSIACSSGELCHVRAESAAAFAQLLVAAR